MIRIISYKSNFFNNNVRILHTLLYFYSDIAVQQYPSNMKFLAMMCAAILLLVVLTQDVVGSGGSSGDQQQFKERLSDAVQKFADEIGEALHPKW